MKISETGRSMVEMLGVLAIMGVLTVGVMLGYRYAMDRILTNSIITGVRARSVIIGQQRVLGQPLNLSEFHPDTEKDLIYGRFEVKAFNNYVYDGEESQAMEVYNIPRRVCENIRMLTFPDETITLVNRSDMGECITDGPRENTGGLHDGGDYFTAEYHNVVTFIFAGLGEACSVNQDCQEGLCCVSLEEGGRGCLPCEDPTDCDQCQEWNGTTCVNKAEGARCLWTPARNGCCTAGVCGACPDRCEGNTCDRLCQTCDSATGECVNHPDGTGCGECKRCENGKCVSDMTLPGCTPQCTTNADCGTCEKCENKACVPDMTLPGCTPQCTTNADCGACEKCENGACVPDLTQQGCTKCHADTDCSDGACCCADGTCSADCCTTKCHADTDCSGGACCCTDGTCSADCCNTKCDADTDCSGGTCCCTDGTCSADCCGTPCSTDENCHYCEQCINERCVPNDNKMCYVDGTGCAMCQGGKCVKRPTKPIKLCNGKIEDCCLYYDNSCEDETGCCTSDAQCDKANCMKCDPTTKKCNQYKKWVRDCNGKPRTCCQDDETCKDGVCVIKCATDADCGAGNTCCSGVCVLAGSGLQCCGGQIVSTDKECCGGRIVDKEKGDECCGGKNLCTNGQWCDGKECAGKMTCTSNGMMNPHRGEPGYVSIQKCCQTDEDCTTLEKSSDCPFKCEGNECRAHKKGNNPCFNCNATTGEKEPLSVGYPIGKCLVCRMVNGQITAVDTTTEGCCWNDEMCQNRNNDKCLRCTNQSETIVGTCVQKDDYEKCSCEANQGTWEDNKCNRCRAGEVWDTSDEAKNYTGNSYTHVSGVGACCPENATYSDESGCCHRTSNVWTNTQTTGCAKAYCISQGNDWDTSDEAKNSSEGTSEGACCPHVAWNGTTCCSGYSNKWTGKPTQVCCEKYEYGGSWLSTVVNADSYYCGETGCCCIGSYRRLEGNQCCDYTTSPSRAYDLFTKKRTATCCNAAKGVWDTSNAAIQSTIGTPEGACCPNDNWTGTECCRKSQEGKWMAQNDWSNEITPGCCANSGGTYDNRYGDCDY